MVWGSSSHRAERRDLWVSGLPKCCTSTQGALVCSDTWPSQQQCQIWGHWQGWGAPSTDVGHVPLSIPVCEHHARLRVCPCAVGGRGRTVLFQASGYVKDH